MVSATIPALGAIDVDVTMTIDPSKLTAWFDMQNGWLVDRGYYGGDGTQFKQAEFDGYYYVTSVSHDIKRGSYKQSFSVAREGLVPIQQTVQVS